MLEEKLYQIEELSDLKVNWTESYKCLDEPLLEYVWDNAIFFATNGISNAPGTHARVISSSLTPCRTKPSLAPLINFDTINS